MECSFVFIVVNIARAQNQDETVGKIKTTSIIQRQYPHLPIIVILTYRWSTRWLPCLHVGCFLPKGGG